jgi:hypothetical protein
MRALAFLLFGLFALSTAATSVSALPWTLAALPMDPTPRAPNAIDATYEFRLLSSLDAFELSGAFIVREVAVSGQGVSAQALREGTALVRAEFEQQFRDVVQAELKEAFSESPPVGTMLRFDYGTSNVDADPYDPPIRVQLAARILLTPALLGLHAAKATEGGELARAFLYSGGRAVIDRTVTVPAGFNAEFEVSVPDFLRLSDNEQQNASSLVFPHDNTRGSIESKLRILFAVGLQPGSVPTNVLQGPTVRATFIAQDDTPLWMKAVPWSAGRYSADLDLWIEVPSISSGYFGTSPLPPNLQASYYSADLLRVAVRERLVTADDVHTFFATLIEDGLREGFGESATIEMDQEAFRESVARPIGGADGTTVAPLLIHASAKLPLRADKMVMGSGIAQTVGTITGIPATFPVSNDGSWILDLTLLYPEGVTVDVADSEHLAQKVRSGDREGVHVLLHPGQSTDVKVHGRPPVDVAVLAIGLLEIGVLVAGITWLVTRARRIFAAKHPWAPRP